jgi:hypothetical protein
MRNPFHGLLAWIFQPSRQPVMACFANCSRTSGGMQHLQHKMAAATPMSPSIWRRALSPPSLTQWGDPPAQYWIGSCVWPPNEVPSVSSCVPNRAISVLFVSALTARCRATPHRERADALEAEVAAAEKELAELQASSSGLDALEQRYWHDFNDFQLHLRAHLDERDSMLSKVRCGPWTASAAHGVLGPWRE